MRVGKNWHIGRLVKGVFNPTENQRAIGVSYIEDHDPDRMTTLAAQRARKQVWPVAQLLGCFVNTRLGCGWNVSSQRSIVQHDGNCGRRETARLRDIANRDHQSRNRIAAELPRS